ncbi:XdhC family protein, partial [Streptomyces sp. SID337]
MLDIADELNRWVEQGRDFAVATVVAVGGSAPRQPGAALAVDSAGTAIGSVSGGCVEGAVYELCRQALEDGETVLERFGYSDDDAFAVGLTCGGIIDILVTPVRADSVSRPVFAAALAAACAGEAAAVARVTSGPAELLGRALLVRTTDGTGAYEGGLGGHPELDRTVAAEARALLDAGRTATVEIGADGSRCGQPLVVLVESSVPPPRMIVFGAIDFASALVRMGKFLGYHVTVCDARPVFATPTRFPDADEIVVEWPHRYLEGTEVDGRTVLCVLTHDAKFDV